MSNYTESSIESPEGMQHIRMRPGMYIGKTGDGTAPDDGIYVLLKEVVDNAIDEFIMGSGDLIEIDIEENRRVTVRDYGRGIPLEKVVDCASKIFTGAKFGSDAFQKSVGLHGVGIKAVNALSVSFVITAYRGRQFKCAEFSKGKIEQNHRIKSCNERNGTKVTFEPDSELFPNFRFDDRFVEGMIRNYVFLNRGLKIVWNGQEFISQNGLKDLLEDEIGSDALYPVFHWTDSNLEIAMTHGPQSGDDCWSYVNGQHTTQGGVHEQVFREVFMKTLREFYGKPYDASDLRTGLVVAVSIRIVDPVFESQTKTKLGSPHMEPKGESIRQYVSRTFQPALDRFLHEHRDVSDMIQRRIIAAEKSRKDLGAVKKLAKERSKQAKVLNKKLTDCTVHFNTKHKDRNASTLFLTEGDSASGPMISVRDPQTQAIFSLRGKPLNALGLTKKVVYENEEFFLLQDALNIEDGIEGLRYNRVILATDADVDGMHIRLLLITFFLQFFPDLIREGHLYILETPLFRVRNKKKTTYCYTDEERIAAIHALGPKPEITRFKGLGEISPKEFSQFIGEGMRLTKITLSGSSAATEHMLEYYMGKNTPERQEYILKHLRADSEAVPDEQLEAKSAPWPTAKKVRPVRAKSNSVTGTDPRPTTPVKNETQTEMF
jgi:topoisomerase-4 subunit B